MFSPIKSMTVVALAMVSLAVAAPASASPLTVGQTVTTGNLLYTLTQCPTLSCTNGDFIAYNGGIKIEGTPFSSATSPSSPGALQSSDTTLVFTVESTDGGYLTGINLGIDGSATTLGDTNAGARVQNFFSPTSNLYPGANASVTGTGSGTVATTSKAFVTQTTKATLTIDVHSAPASGNSAQVNYLTAQVTKVPEPVSTALLLSGLVSVAAIRRRRAR